MSDGATKKHSVSSVFLLQCFSNLALSVGLCRFCVRLHCCSEFLVRILRIFHSAFHAAPQFPDWRECALCFNTVEFPSANAKFGQNIKLSNSRRIAWKMSNFSWGYLGIFLENWRRRHTKAPIRRLENQFRRITEENVTQLWVNVQIIKIW